MYFFNRVKVGEKGIFWGSVHYELSQGTKCEPLLIQWKCMVWAP